MAREVKAASNLINTSGITGLTNVAGTLITMLDAFLVNGYGTVTLDSLVVSGGVATGTLSTGHGFTEIDTGVGVVLTIAGATPSALNGDFDCTIVSSTQFSFTTTESDGTATGTITAKIAPQGSWEKSFSGTNKAVYKSTATGASGTYIRVDDTYGGYALVRLYSGMTDVDTGTALTTAVSMYKSSAASPARSFFIAADRKLFYLVSWASGTGPSGGIYAGDIDSYMGASDPNPCALCGSQPTTNGTNLSAISNAAYSFAASNYLGTASDVAMSRLTHGQTANIAAAGQAYPAPADTSLHLWPVEIQENTVKVARGLMPGWYGGNHTFTAISSDVIAMSTGVLSGRKVFLTPIGLTTYFSGFDITGPWR